MTDVRDIPEEPTGDYAGNDIFFPEQSFPEQSVPEPTFSDQNFSDQNFPDQTFPDEEEGPSRKRAPLTARGVALLSGRLAAGIIGIGVAGVAIAGAGLLPLPTVGSSAPSQLVTPVPTAQQLVCSGSFLRLSDETGQDATTASAIGRATMSSASSSGSVDAAPLEQSDASTGGTPAAPTLISTPPNPADPTEQILLSGAQVQVVSEGDFVGLTASDCGVASGDIWLAGGSTAVGRTTLLTLSNPTEVPATVNLELFGETGAIAAPGTSGIIVPADGQRVLSLAGFQPDVVSPVVHVTSSGGQVVAELQQAIVRGLVPGGVDIIGATSSPALESVIPGLQVTNLAGTQQMLSGGESFEDVRTVLRLFAPGEGDTVTMTISFVPEDATDTGTSFTAEVETGRVVDIPVEELANGNYTVKVSSPVPAISAARVTSVTGNATDFAWLGGSSPLQERAQFTAVDADSPVLHLANPTDADATVTLTASEGSDLTVTVPAGASAVLPVAPGTSYELGGFDRMFAAVTVAQSGFIARYSVHPPGEGSSSVRVYP